MKHTKIFQISLLSLIIASSSCSKEKQTISTGTRLTPTPVTSSSSVGDVFKSQIWIRDWPPGTDLWCIRWVGAGIFVNHPYSLSPQFGTDYYSDHVRVYIKPSEAELWQAAPFVPQDYNGATTYELYYTDNNYIADLGALGVVIAPRILILAKSNAAIDFSKPFDVKFVFV
jgi:hypothetical protein